MNKKTLLLFLAFASLIVVGTHLLFKPSNEMPQAHPIQDVKTVANNLNKLDIAHISELKKLKENNEFLVAKIQQTKTQVLNAQKQANFLRSELRHLPKKQTLIAEVDTGTYVNLCDSLQQELDQYMNANSYKDSVVNEQVGFYELLITSKDSTIVCLETDYKNMKASCDTLMNWNKILANENKHKQKLCLQIKRKEKFITGTAFLLVGLATGTRLRSVN